MVDNGCTRRVGRGMSLDTLPCTKLDSTTCSHEGHAEISMPASKPHCTVSHSCSDTSDLLTCRSSYAACTAPGCFWLLCSPHHTWPTAPHMGLRVSRHVAWLVTVMAKYTKQWLPCSIPGETADLVSADNIWSETKCQLFLHRLFKGKQVLFGLAVVIIGVFQWQLANLNLPVCHTWALENLLLEPRKQCGEAWVDDTPPLPYMTMLTHMFAFIHCLFPLCIMFVSISLWILQ